ncbi:hypothetical protein CVT24_006085 [Panaeolus cyanescens]|uniref:Uncharacterized protein n=1 Tax=Panaeolus cyanescens TaxID=181874 RepID=A0A409VAT9_9AGAR|nr:hypothetical protein CVT24_006085 [Panaeolus cyanescens]
MSVAPTSSTPRGEVAVQPNYFTSSIYVKALRDDISTLVLNFYEAYSKNTATPFKSFKSIWTSMGWHWLHFKVFDHRTRKTFLDVTLRLFLDHYSNLMSLPETMTSQHLLPLQPHVQFILRRLRTGAVFFLLPRSEDGPMNPRSLPREIYAPEGTSYALELGSQKRKGRPTKKEKGKKARHALEGLDVWLSKNATEDEDTDVTPVQLAEYQRFKSYAMEVLKEEYGDSGLLTAADDIGRAVLMRMKDADAAMGGEGNSSGVQILEKAVEDFKRTLLVVEE